MITASLNQNIYDTGRQKLQSRNNVLFATGAAAVFAGIFFPDSTRLLDLLIIFTLCLTGSVIAVAFSSRRAYELNGFGLMVVLTLCSQITSAIAVSKSLVTDGSASLTVTAMSKLSLIFQYFTTSQSAIFFTAVVTAVFLLTYRISKSILRNSRNFLETISNARQAQNSIDTDRTVLDSEQKKHDKNINLDANFFLAGVVISKFLLCCAAILIIVSFANLLIALISSAAFNSKEIINTALSCPISFQSLILLTAAAIFGLLKKTGPRTIEENCITEEQYKQRIKVVAREIASSSSLSPADTEISHIEKETDSKTLHINDNAASLWYANEIDKEDSYKTIAQLFTNNSCRTILMASANTEQLPVTLPVNIAMNLVNLSRKVLLIDCDLQRKAVLQVFDIENKESLSAESCVRNLWIGLPESLSDKAAGKTAIKQFDNIIIYTPRIRNLSRAKHLLRLCRNAMLFGQSDKPEHSDMKLLRKVLGDLSCSVLEPSVIFENI